MRLIFHALVAMVILPVMLAERASAQGAPVYVATYVEVMPNAVASGAALLKRYALAGRREGGSLQFTALHEIARPARFAIFAVWRDQAALDDHEKAAGTSQFRERLKKIAEAPDDMRINSGLYVGPVTVDRQGGAIFTLTHVDVLPQYMKDCTVLLKALGSDAATDAGTIGYDVLQQAGHPNHFTVFGQWTTRKAFDAYMMAPHTRAFREKLSPMIGALYDERVYEKLN